MDQDRGKDWRELCQAAATELERDERRNIASENQKTASRVFSVSTVA